MNLFNRIHTTLNPHIFQGHGKHGPYFEGWYFKLVNADGSQRWSIIPGVYVGKDSRDSHAFIQVLDGVSGRSIYKSYPYDAFHAQRRAFEVQVAGSYFSAKQIKIDLDHTEISVSGALSFKDLTPWPVRLWSPGIMGWYAWVPYMECYHGVVSLDHSIEGNLTINNDTISFSKGRGYIEKDWGQAMPRAWIWLQCNHFNRVGASLTASLAVIPWRGSEFNGFIVGLWDGETLHRFATYTGARLERFCVNQNEIEMVLRQGPKRLTINAKRAESSALQAPTTEQMDRRIMESLSAEVHVKLTQGKGNKMITLFEDTGKYAGLEIVGEMPT